MTSDESLDGAKYAFRSTLDLRFVKHGKDYYDVELIKDCDAVYDITLNANFNVLMRGICFPPSLFTESNPLILFCVDCPVLFRVYVKKDAYTPMKL
jgi:hypothetical protein